MKSAVHDDVDTNTRWLQKKTLFGKAVRFEKTKLMCSDSILYLLVVAIEGTQIEIGRGVRDVLV